MNIDPIGGNRKLANGDHRHNCKSFIDFEPVDVRDLQSRLGQGLLRSGNDAGQLQRRIVADGHASQEPSPRLETVALRHFAIADQHGRGAVGNLARVGGRHHAAAIGTEDRGQAGDLGGVQQVTGQLTDSSRLKVLRRDIARMETILRETELAAVEGA